MEEQFYLIFPMIVRYIAPNVLPFVLAVLIAVAPIVRIAVFHWFSDGHLLATYTLMPCRSDALLLGALCAWAVRDNRARHFLASNQQALSFAAFVLLLGTIYLAITSPNYYQRRMVFFGLTWIAVLFSTVVLITIQMPDGFLGKVFALSPLRALGRIAYGVYLFHLPVIGALHGTILHQAPVVANKTDAALTIAAVSATVFLAWLSLRYFESPITAAGRLLGYNFSAKSLAEPQICISPSRR